MPKGRETRHLRTANSCIANRRQTTVLPRAPQCWVIYRCPWNLIPFLVAHSPMHWLKCSLMYQFLGQLQRVTGRKSRGLQREEIDCKCQTFLSLLRGRRKQTGDTFSFSIQISKEVSLKMLCCHDTWFYLKPTILKPWVNQYIFLMEMFILKLC